VILDSHGWADDDKACYKLMLDLIGRAARHSEACDRA
jgi:hypothetical protein